MRTLAASLLGLALLASFAAPAAAATSDDLEFFREEAKVVTASRREQPISEAPSAISVITRKDIELSAARTIPELIQYVVGMDGFTKTRTQMDVGPRGSAVDEANKTLVLIDGQPANLVVHSGMEWPTLPVTLGEIERIEIVRGPASVIYGADALTGVINIITTAARGRKSSVHGLIGEDAALQGGFGLARVLNERWSASLNGVFTQTQGKGIATTPQDALAAPNWDVKDWAKVYTGTYRVDYKGDALEASSSGGVSVDREGYNPSPGDLAVDRARRLQAYLNEKVTRRFDEDSLSVRVGLRDYWQFNEKWTGTAYTEKYDVPKSYGVDADAQYTLRRVPGHALIAGAGLSALEASRDIVSNVPPYRYDEKDRLVSFYAQDQFGVLDDRLSLTVGGRYDKWYRFAGVFTPRAAVNAFFLDRRLSLRAAVATSFRRPAFDENYYFVNLGGGGWFKGSQITNTTASGRLVAGTPLRPEKLTSYETGARWSPGAGFTADLELYYQTIKDSVGIVTYPNLGGPPNITIANAPGTTYGKGAELELKERLDRRLSGFANYAYEYSRFNAPTNKASFGVLYEAWANVDLRYRYVSAVVYSDIPSQTVSAYGTLDVAVSKRFADRWFVKAGVLDLLNTAHYEYPIYTQMTRKAALSAQYFF